MTQIFIAYAQEEDAECAEHIRQGLEALLYAVWREPPSLSLSSILYPRTIDNGILGSAAVVLLWSNNAERSERVERQILFAQRLKKLILPVELDGTALPNTLISVSPIMSSGSCIDVAAQLMPLLPLPNSQDPLITLSEQAAQNFIRLRKEAIDHAAEMLQRGVNSEPVLALLEYLANNDVMMGVREKAQEVLDTSTKKVTSPRSSSESRHIFGVRCPNGHISYFDKRRTCPDYSISGMIERGITQRAGAELDELLLRCTQCDAEMLVRIDCGGYKHGDLLVR